MTPYERLAWPMSTLQRRISMALLAVIVLFVAAQGLLAYSSLEEQEDELVDDLVLAETRRLIGRMADGDQTLLQAPGPVRLAPNMRAWLTPAGRAGADASLPQHLRDLSEGTHRLHHRDEILHVVIQQIEAGRLQVVYDATRNEAFVYEFGVYLIVMGVAIIAIGWLVSVWVAGIVVMPIRRLAERLAQWAPGTSTRTASQSDEESLLLRAFDQAQRKLDEAIAHEREFAANVRHEVRTPLAALRSDAEMLMMTVTDPAARERLQRMMTTVDAVADSVDASWSLTRAQPTQPEQLDLRACVDSAWASLQHLNGDGRMRLVNRVDDSGDRSSRLDRQALMTVLRNLLRNAIEHASPGTCEVRETPVGIEVADDGRGIATEDLPRIFERSYRGRLVDSASDAPGQERGLGLAIARQTALQQGWLLTVRSAVGQGTVFRLDFQT